MTKERYFSTFQLILLALFAALIVVAKIALRLPLQLSGHSGVFWMAIMIVAAGVVPKRGAASLVGLTSGIMAGFLGLGDFGALNTFLSYTAVGVGTDLALWLLG
ncbi:MAG: cobalt ABC transporter permease, partial [Anaerolineae bacterium]